MQGSGIRLADNYSNAVPADQAPQGFAGGKAALVITATLFPTTCILRYKARGADLDIQAVAANGMFIFDLPAGQYYLHMAGAGAATAVNADLVTIPQG